MRSILIHFPDNGIPIFQFIGDCDSEVAILKDWIARNLRVMAEGQIPNLRPATQGSLAGGECGRLCPTLSETSPTLGFHSQR